jgi:hypothetical protein
VTVRWNRALSIGLTVAVLGFAAAALALYQFRPTPAVVFLVLGWMSILGAGFFLVRAVSSFDLAPIDEREALAAMGRTELEREKKLLLKAIKEAEFDRDTGKLEGGEADEVIARYRARAIEILHLLDEDPERRHLGAIERELARRLAAGDEPAAPGSCAACQTMNDADAAFCKKCGMKLGGAA